MKKKLKVAAIISLDNKYKYDILRGVIQFAKHHGQWSLHGQNHVFHNLKSLRNWKGDGIIAHIETKREMDKLTSLGLPIIDVCGTVPTNYKKINTINNDDTKVGANVAQHFLESGLTEFAFVGVSRRRWSIERKNGFTENLPIKLRDQRIFLRPQSFWSTYWNTKSSQQELIQWLKTRPLSQLGVMAADDSIGAQIIESCQTAKIHVPSEIAVVGVNNDIVVCEFSDPPLSSVPLSSLEIGLHAAATLNEMMTNQKLDPTREKESIRAEQVVLRGSSSYENENNATMRAAVNFILSNKGTPINVADVVKHCNAGRRSLEISFRKTFGHTIYEEISQQKIQHACVLLQRSNKSITEIAFETGFNSYQRFHAAFRKFRQKTPKEFRQSYRLDQEVD